MKFEIPATLEIGPKTFSWFRFRVHWAPSHVTYFFRADGPLSSGVLGETDFKNFEAGRKFHYWGPPISSQNQHEGAWSGQILAPGDYWLILKNEGRATVSVTVDVSADNATAILPPKGS